MNSTASKTACLLVGMHRSGTSLASYLLKVAGADLGKTIMPPAPDNPKGFWENVKVMHLNDRLLASVGSAWDWPSTHRYGRELSEIQTHFETVVHQVVASEFDQGSGLIAIKDPRISLLLDSWVGALERMRYEVKTIISLRHPADVCQSLRARDEIHPDHAGALWMEHVESWLRHDSEALVLDYGTNISNPESVYRAVQRYLDVPEKEGAVQLVQEFVDLSLNRSGNSRVDSPFSEFFEQRLVGLANEIVGTKEKRMLLKELKEIQNGAGSGWDSSVRMRIMQGQLHMPRIGPSYLFPLTQPCRDDLDRRRNVAALSLELRRRPAIAVPKHLGDSLKALLDAERENQELTHSLDSLQQTHAKELEISRAQVEELVSLVEFVGESRRWRIGDFIVSILRRMLGRSRDSAIVEQARAIAARRQN